MNISPEEAQASLAAIQQTRAQMRKESGAYSYFSIIWGLIWFVGFLSSQFLQSNQTDWIWGIGVTIGWVLSAILGFIQERKARSVVGARHGFFYLALIGFTILWLVILQPLSLKQSVLFFVTIVFFGGTISGILVRNVPTIIICLVATGLACLGYYLFPSYFFLWMALLLGLPMVIAGIVIRLRWR